MEDTKELEFILRSLLISSPKVTSANKLLKDYEDSENRPFPFRKLGFGSFVEYLRSIPSVVQLSPINSYNPDVLPVVTKASSHIDKLVSKQKVTAPKRSNSRRSGFNGRPSRSGPPRRRPTTFNPSTYFRPAPNKGVPVKDIDNNFSKCYNREDLTRNGIHSGNDLLHHANTMVKRVNDRVYPNMTLHPDFSSRSNQNSYNPEIRAVPAASEENDEDFQDDFDEDFWDEVSEEELSNYTLEKLCTKSQPHYETTERDEEIKEAKEDKSYANDQVENFSKVMINNFRYILAKHPNGLWASELQTKYFEEFGVTLDLLDLGYSSAITMVSHLPDVFRYERAGSHDWKLFDARSTVGNSTNRVKLEGFVECLNGVENYIPQAIIENIIKLVKQHGCIRSTDLLSFYLLDFKKNLDMKSLGFDGFEGFLDTLKSYINITKVQDYFLLMPKHSLVKIETAAPSEVLTVPKESFSFSFPDNIVRLEDTIPYQELPTIDRTKLRSPADPLLELEVRLAEVFSPDYFYFSLDSKYNDLQNMMEDLDKFYNLEESNFHIPLPYIAQNLICACVYSGCWHRAKITGCRKHDSVEIEYIDYGTPQTVKRSELRFLHKTFAQLPAQSICAKLMGVRPPNGSKKWPVNVCEAFLKMVTDKRLIAHVYKIGVKHTKEIMQLELVLYDTNGPEEIIYNELLIQKKLADDYCQVEGAPERAVQVENCQDNSAKPNQSRTHLNCVEPPKPATRPPPGFEAFHADSKLASYQVPKSSDTVQPQPTVYCPPSSKGIYNYPYIVGENINIPPTLNYPLFHQSQQIMNSPYFVTNNSFYYSNVFQNPPPMGYLQPVQSYSYSPQSSYLPQSNSIIPRLPLDNAPKVGNPLNITRLPQETQNNYIRRRMLEKIPGWSGDLTNSQTAAQTISRSAWQPAPAVPLESSFPSPLPSSVPSLNICSSSSVLSSPSPSFVPPESYPSQRNNTHASTDTSFKWKPEKETLISRPDTPLTPSSAEVANFCYKRNDGQKTTNSTDQTTLLQQSQKEMKNLLENTSLYEATNNDLQAQYPALSYSPNPVTSPSTEILNIDPYRTKREIQQPLMNKKLDEVAHISSGLENLLRNSNHTRNSSASDEYASASEQLELCNSPNSPELQSIKGTSPPSSLHLEKEMSGITPDSWEDIDPDDTPANSKYFIEDFKKPLDFIINEKDAQQNINLSSDLVVKRAENNFENSLLSTESIKAPVNWKDFFDPDIISKPKWCDGGKVDNTVARSSDQISVKKVLVQKLVINEKFFHLICVKEKPAVLALEFYPQFTPFNLHTISKIIDVKHKPFPVISKCDEPALFSELQKIESFGGVEKKTILKLGKASFSYLDEVPEVFAVLNVKDQLLLDALRKISDDFESF